MKFLGFSANLGSAYTLRYFWLGLVVPRGFREAATMVIDGSVEGVVQRRSPLAPPCLTHPHPAPVDAILFA